VKNSIKILFCPAQKIKLGDNVIIDEHRRTKSRKTGF
jgi:hypothetical protein